MKISPVIFFSLVVVALGNSLSADDKKNQPTWTDPREAAAEDPSFLIQGEYECGSEGEKIGLQVIAMGGGQFDAYLLAGGLPGAGWERDMARTKLVGGFDDDQSTVSLESGDGAIGVTITGEGARLKRGEESTALTKIQRTSPTLGAEPPADAVVLFDGTNADAWKNGKVEGGLLPNLNVTTHEKFGSYHLHLEFRTPYKPYARGQGRGNSGVYHQGRYETQVLDSFGLEGKMNETGGIYGIAAPRVNACLPPLAWQTYDVDLTTAEFNDAGEKTANARITVRLNGILIHEDVELPKTTGAAPVKSITPEPGPIFIQHHGNPVYYRNIWIQKK